MNRTIRPWASTISFSTAFSRSSNSPRYLAPATSAPMSRATMRLSFSPSGTSPRTIRWARPSTIAVLPTPGSPMSTGLFLVRRASTWMTRRTSSSRPITGSSLPRSASVGQVAAVALERLVLALGILVGDAMRAAHLGERRRSPPRGDAQPAQQLGGRRSLALADDGQEQVLGADELILHPRRFGLRLLQHSGSGAARCRARCRPGRVGWRLSCSRMARRDRGRGVAQLLEQRRDDAAGLLGQRHQEMFGLRLRRATGSPRGAVSPP